MSISNSAQKLNYESNGNVLNSENIKISPEEVRTALQGHQQALELYDEGRNKKTIGNVLLCGGLGLITADLLLGATADVQYPTALTIVGALSTIIAIPVKIGYSKKIKNAISNYNEANSFGYTKAKINLVFISNNKGLGFKMIF